MHYGERGGGKSAPSIRFVFLLERLSHRISWGITEGTSAEFRRASRMVMDRIASLRARISRILKRGRHALFSRAEGPFLIGEGNIPDSAGGGREASDGWAGVNFEQPPERLRPPVPGNGVPKENSIYGKNRNCLKTMGRLPVLCCTAWRISGTAGYRGPEVIAGSAGAPVGRRCCRHFPQGRCVPDSEPFHAMPGCVSCLAFRAPRCAPACIRCRGNVRPGKTDYGSVWGTDRFSGKAMRKKRGRRCI